MTQIPNAAVMAALDSWFMPELENYKPLHFEDMKEAFSAALPYLQPVDVAAVREQCAKLCDQSAALSSEQAENTMNPAVKCTLMGEAASARVLAKQIRSLSAEPALGEQLPQDIINLIIAAREFWDDHNDLSPESDALDKALMPFASLVPYGNDPDEEKL